MDGRYVFGNRVRIFLNLDLGCTSACSYCYLPQEGLEVGRRLQKTRAISADTLIAQLFKTGEFVAGKHGTVLSIGCFSETWDPANRPETIALIRKLAESENPIQVATKRQVTKDQLISIEKSLAWEGQLTFYLSSASVSAWKVHESKTEDPHQRLESLQYHHRHGAGFVLYIKPVLAGVTIQDLPFYKELLRRHPVPVVVGDRFDTVETGSPSPISSTLFIAEEDDIRTIRDELSTFSKVYANSLDVVEHYRGS